MRKSIAAISIILTLLAGIGIGAGGMYYAKIVLPEKEAAQLAQKLQEEMIKMVRSGTVTAVSRGQLTMKVEKSGDSAVGGKELTVNIDSSTMFQKGMDMLNNPGEHVDVQKLIKTGMKVNVIENNRQALVVYWNPSL